MKELDRISKFLDAQQMDFAERLKNCRKVIQENALSIKQQEKFMETMAAEGKEDPFASRAKQETIDKNKETEEKVLQKLKEESRQRAFLYKSLEAQYAQIQSLKEDLKIFDDAQYVVLKKEDFLKQIEEATKEAVKEAKKAFTKEAKENQKKEEKKTAAKELKKAQSDAEASRSELMEGLSEFAKTVENYVFMDPGRVLQELELLKNKLDIK